MNVPFLLVLLALIFAALSYWKSVFLGVSVILLAAATLRAKQTEPEAELHRERELNLSLDGMALTAKNDALTAKLTLATAALEHIAGGTVYARASVLASEALRAISAL